MTQINVVDLNTNVTNVKITKINSIRECPLFSSIRQTMVPPISNKLVKRFEKNMKTDPDFWFETTSSLTGNKHRWSYDRSVKSFECSTTKNEDTGLTFTYIPFPREVS